MNQPWDWAILPRLTTRKCSKDIRPVHIQDVSTTDTDTLLDENDLKAKQDDVNRNEYRSLWRTHYRPVAQEGERDQTTAEIH